MPNYSDQFFMDNYRRNSSSPCGCGFNRRADQRDRRDDRYDNQRNRRDDRRDDRRDRYNDNWSWR